MLLSILLKTAFNVKTTLTLENCPPAFYDLTVLTLKSLITVLSVLNEIPLINIIAVITDTRSPKPSTSSRLMCRPKLHTFVHSRIKTLLSIHI